MRKLRLTSYNPRKYRIRIAIACFVAGWFLSALYYGAIPPKAAAQEVVSPPPAPPKIDVICTFDFPALPVAALEDTDAKR